MSNTAVAINQQKAGEIIEAVIARGDIAQLSPDERAKFYVKVCESVGLNPMTRPFEYITLNGKLTLYARKDCTDQLRSIHKVSVTDLIESERDGVFIVTAKVVNGEGRADAAKGAVTVNGLKGEALANALMKAETKAKRRATLSICGLGFLDETEVETIPAEARSSNVQTLPTAANGRAPVDIGFDGELVSAEQLKTLNDKFAQLGGVSPATLAYFEVASLSDLAAKDYPRVLQAVNKKIAEIGK
jgi:hypothetical protein